jgi:type II secretory pathway component GspD/PulD (secretin)
MSTRTPWTPVLSTLPYLIRLILVGGLTLQYVLLAIVNPQIAEAFAQVYPEGQGFISIEATGEPLNELIPKIAKLSHLNVLMDESVTGNASLKLDRISGLDALKVLARMHGLSVQSYGKGIWMISSQAMGQELGLYRYNTKTIALQHASAAWLASFLNTALFTGSTRIVVKANERQNSLVVSGTDDEVKMVLKAIPEFDVPRLRRVYQLSYAHALDVARQLEAVVFGNRGTAGLNGVTSQVSVSDTLNGVTEGSGTDKITGNSGGGSGSSGGGSGSSGGASGGSSGGGSGGSSGGGSGGSSGGGSGVEIKVRTQGLTQTTYTVQTLGAIVMPNSKNNTLTIIATESQLEEAESLLPLLDAKPPQVSIQADLIEVSSTALKQLGMKLDFTESGSPWGFNIGSITPGTSNNISFLPKVPQVDNLNLQIQALIQTGKAKSIASPHIVATHDTESAIVIADQILRGQEFTASGSGFFGQTTPLIGSAGITLDIIPKIGANGVITLRVRPIVSSVYASAGVGASTIQLVRSRDLVAQAVSVKDGESMVIGGLVDARDTSNEQKIPGLADLPIVGAMFRASASSSAKSELLILITPHILNQLELTPIHRIDRDFQALENIKNNGTPLPQVYPIGNTSLFSLNTKERP